MKIQRALTGEKGWIAKSTRHVGQIPSQNQDRFSSEDGGRKSLSEYNKNRHPERILR